MKHVDLHTHTIYSDGTDSPESLVRAMIVSGVEAMALTDHDTMAGYDEALKEAKKWNLELIPGVEVSTHHYHILGLNVDPENQEFRKFLDEVQRRQKEVCVERIGILNNYGVPITVEKLEKAYPLSRLGKWNVINTMIQDPECASYLSKEKYKIDPAGNPTPETILRYFVGTKGIAGKISKNRDFSSRESIAQIHNAGGIAIVAHAFKQIKRWDDRESVYFVLGKLKERNIDGVEIQPNYGEKNNLIRDYALENGLMMTYGSDFHGAGGTRQLLGRRENQVEDLEKMLNKWRN
ncbi:hypothetical protein COU54_01795 [Candidatus Pacearchaeota archaeon CG10_big_fil_rev_8_21_14_0_10_31_24]|nr:MAG: hypothetical protein COU54_01795 [Candidatus Pacearchaeota archaeon CG10_big_fil_rev_8_21_14_0_10_31_24]